MTPQTHALKCHPKYYEEVVAGRKPFELRKADRPFAVGDLLVLMEWCPQAECYTGRQCARVISYVGRDLPGLQKWHVALGLRELDADLGASRPDLCEVRAV